jgi:hypothetical protein
MHDRGPRRYAAIGAVLTSAVVFCITLLPLPAGAANSKPKWDARVVPIVRAVERLRNLKFEHPVPVDFLSDADFEARVAVDSAKLSANEKAELDRAQAGLRAIGLLPSGVDLLAATTALRQSGALAFYDPQTRRITVRGEELTPAVKVTLAHELTHALQDQHFDLKALQKRAVRTHSSLALTALVEGDAVRVQQRYGADLPAAERAQYESTRNSGASDALAEARSHGVPDSLVALFQTPYALGPSMLEVVQAAKGDGALDALFRRPPVADVAYLAPRTLVDGTTSARVDAPALEPGETADGKPDVFGALMLYLALATQSDPVDALRVADAWGGDAMVTFTRGETRCLRATFVGRTPAGTTAIGDALQQWAVNEQGDSVQAVTDRSRATLTACDPGANGATVDDHSLAALTVVAVRNTLLATLAQQGVTAGVADCTANGVVTDPAFRPVLDAAVADPNATPDADTLRPLQQRIFAIAATCARAR